MAALIERRPRPFGKGASLGFAQVRQEYCEEAERRRESAKLEHEVDAWPVGQRARRSRREAGLRRARRLSCGACREAFNLPLEYDLDNRSGALIRYEMQQMPALPLWLHHPLDGALALRCRRFIEQPHLHERIDDWNTALGMSRRSFTRIFRRETGPVSWLGANRPACYGPCPGWWRAPVTTVAMDWAMKTRPRSRSCSNTLSAARPSPIWECGRPARPEERFGPGHIRRRFGRLKAMGEIFFELLSQAVIVEHIEPSRRSSGKYPQ